MIYGLICPRRDTPTCACRLTEFLSPPLSLEGAFPFLRPKNPAIIFAGKKGAADPGVG